MYGRELWANKHAHLWRNRSHFVTGHLSPALCLLKHLLVSHLSHSMGTSCGYFERRVLAETPYQIKKIKKIDPVQPTGMSGQKSSHHMCGKHESGVRVSNKGKSQEWMRNFRRAGISFGSFLTSNAVQLPGSTQLPHSKSFPVFDEWF